MADRPTVLDTADLVVVPKEPTEAMEEAHFAAHADAKTVFAEVSDIWSRMISASPHPTAWEEVKAYVAELEVENSLLKRVIAWANNSLFGSHGFFLSLSGDNPADEHHLDKAVEELKELNREYCVRIRELEDRLEAAEKVIAPFVEASDYFTTGIHRRPAEDALPCGPALIVKHLRAAAKWMEDRNAEV